MVPPRYVPAQEFRFTEGGVEMHILAQTNGELHLYADGTNGDDGNDGLQESTGQGGEFAKAGQVVTFTPAPFRGMWSPKRMTAKMITILGAESPDNNGAFVIIKATKTMVSYNNAKGVAESFPATGRWAVASPKKSLRAAIDLVPFYVHHNVCIHLSGIFNDPGTVTLEKFVSKTNVLLVDGGVSTTGGPPCTAQITPSSLQVTPPPLWGIDQYVGHWVEILSGPAKGQTRMIQANTPDSITPVRNFSLGSGTTAKIRVVHPSTEITQANFVLRNLGNGTLQAQSLTASGTASTGTQNSPGQVNCSHLFIPSNGSPAFYGVSSTSIELSANRYHPFTFTLEDDPKYSQAGVSQIGTKNLKGMVFLGIQEFVKVSASYATILHFYGATPNIGEGSRARRLLLYSVGCYTTVPLLTGGIRDSGSLGYATTRFGGVGGAPADSRRAGIGMFNSGVTIKGPVDLTTPTAHGLEVLGNSFVYVMGAGAKGEGASLTGKAKNFGVYIHGNSCLHIAENADTPTLTGAKKGDDISTDGANLRSTWIDIMNGKPIADPAEMVTVKKYGLFP